MDPRKPTKDEQDFVRVVQIATALGLGLMAAFLYSLKQIHPSIQLKTSFGTFVAFLLTAGFSWVFCGVLFKGEFTGDSSVAGAPLRKKRAGRWLIFFVATSGLATAGAFLYSLKDVSAESRWDVLEGAGIAMAVLTVGGFLIHKAVRFFEEQDKVGLEEPHDSDDVER